MMDDNGHSMGNGIVLGELSSVDWAADEWYKVWCFKHRRWYRMRSSWLEMVLPCSK